MATVYRTPLFFNPGGNTADAYVCFGGAISTSTTEANRQIKFYRSGYLKNLRCYVSANSAASSTTLITRKNGSNGNCSFSIGAGATGSFEDTTNYDTISSGDLACMLIDRNDSGSLTIAHGGIDFLCTTATSKFTLSGTSLGLGTASVTRYYYPFGNSGIQTTESQIMQPQFPAAGTAKNLNLYVSANGRSTSTTFTLRINSADSAVTLSVGSSATGRFEDTSNTVSVSAGDSFNYSITTSTGTGTITVQNIGFEVENTTTGSVSSGSLQQQSFGNNTTNYISMICSEIVSTTEANQNPVLRGTGTIRKLYVYSSANTASNTTTFTARKNSSDQSLTTSFATTVSGVSSDTSNSFTYADGDKVCLKENRGSGSTGTFTYNWSMWENLTDGEAEPSAGSIFNPYYFRLLGNSGSGMNV